MASTAIHNIEDLSTAQVESLEALLGQPLAAAGQVQIFLYPRPILPDPKIRQEVLGRIEQFLDRAAESVRAQGVTDEEIDAAVDEALDHVRNRPA